MPRIRSIKPEALQHRKVGRLSDRAFRLWVAMITLADDEGRLIADADHLRFMTWGYHPKVTTAMVVNALTEIERQGLIRLYHRDGTGYADFPSWGDHQRIHKDHFSPSKIPKYLECGTGTVPVQDPDGTCTGLIPLDRIGSDRNGSETTLSGTVAPDRAQFRAQAREILHFLNEKTGRTFRDEPVNLDLIEARLKSGATLANCRGVIARKVREWQGNPDMAKYLRPSTLFNRTKFEQYLGERPSDGAV